tara:strand:+ start:214 stop:420 length:207 start_codon:yes stop_codon:yes gene_type:complete
MAAKALLVAEGETECARADRQAVQEATMAAAMEVVLPEVQHLRFRRVFSERPLKLHLINAAEDPCQVC